MAVSPFAKTKWVPSKIESSKVFPRKRFYRATVATSDPAKTGTLETE